MVEITTFGTTFNFLLWCIAFLYYKSENNRYIKKSYFPFWAIASISYTFYNLGWDYIGYADLYSQMQISNEPIHVEPFYFFLIKTFPFGYHFWRFIVWSMGVTLIIIAFKKQKTNPTFSCFIFILLLFINFGYPRNSLGFAALFVGISFLFFSKNKKISLKILGLIMIVCSNFLHKSMFMYILLMSIALIPIGKKIFITSLIGFPLLYKSVTYISSYILLNSFANETSQESGTGYLESDFRAEANINGLIQLFITRLPVFLLLFYCIRNIFFKKEQIQYSHRIFLQYTYWLVYVSYLFMGQEVSAFLSNRFWDAALYPLTFFLAAYLYNKPRTRFINNCFYLLILSNLYQLTYAIYKTL